MRRVALPSVVMALGLVLGGAIAGWPSRVKSDVVIDAVPTSVPAAESTVATDVPAGTTVP